MVMACSLYISDSATPTLLELEVLELLGTGIQDTPSRKYDSGNEVLLEISYDYDRRFQTLRLRTRPLLTKSKLQFLELNFPDPARGFF